MHQLLLADLHLPNKASPFGEAFLRFCAGPARSAEQVFILGDLFEYWIGDAPSISEHPEEVRALRALSDAGVRVHLQHGNRDFMIGKAFAAATGVRLMADEEVLPIAGVPTLLSHGDRYCTDDEKYQRWRRFSRRPLAQWAYLRLSVARRRKIAGALRSDTHKQMKPEQIMDVNAAAIEDAFRRHGVSRLIHGHTHRPASHALMVDGRACERLVLPDWRPERIEWLRADDNGLTLQGFGDAAETSRHEH